MAGLHSPGGPALPGGSEGRGVPPAHPSAWRPADLPDDTERLRMALHAAGVATWDIDLRACSLTGSSNLAAVVGFAPAATLRGALRQVHPKDRRRVAQAFRAAARRGLFLDLEFRCGSDDAHDTWLRARGHAPESDSAGRQCLMGVLQNVTGRRRRDANTVFLGELHAALAPLESAEAIMREAAQRLAAHLRADNVAFVEIDPDADTGEVLYSLRQDATGGGPRHYRIADFVSASYLAPLRRGELVVVEDIASDPRTRPLAAAFLTRGVQADIESPFLSDGRWRFHLSVVSAQPRRWRADETELVREVTVRAWLRLERARAEARLRQSEERFELAGSAARVFAWEVDIDSERVAMGERLPEMLGFDPPLTASAFLRAVHPEDRDHAVRQYQRAVAGVAPLHVELRVLHPVSGRVHWLRCEGVVLRHADGRPHALAGVTVDVTRRREAEEALRQANQRKNEFLATLAHELRNPLAPLRNGLEILRRDPVLSADAPLAAVREMMGRQVDTLARLVDDLLEVARISRGAIELRRQPSDLAAVLDAAVERSRPLVDEMHHALHIVVPRPGPWLLVDPVRIAQVVSNLLNNAAKYTDPGGSILLWVEQPEDGSLLVRVRDTGVGIPPDMLGEVFALFAQVDRRCGRTQGGLGIGLSLADQLVRLHGGHVEAHSAGTGHGSEFVVHLPASLRCAPAQATGAAPWRNSAGGAPAPAFSGRPCRTLVVDDNRDAADSLRTMLQLMGAEVEAAYDGASALQLAHRFCPEAIVLDIGMPGMDGYEVARAIRQDPALHHVRLVALTGWGQETDRSRAREAGFDHHLVKPVDVDALQRVLDCAGGELPASRPHVA